MKTIKRIIGKGCPVCLTNSIIRYDVKKKLWKCDYCNHFFIVYIPKSLKLLKEMEIPE